MIYVLCQGDFCRTGTITIFCSESIIFMLKRISESKCIDSFSFRPYIRAQSEIKHFQFLCLTPQILRKAKIAIADSEIAQLTRLNFVYFHKYMIILLMYITISNEYCSRLTTKYTIRIHSSIKYHTFCLCPYQKKPICNLY